MNKYFRLLLTLLILTLALTACATAQASPETLRRLDEAAWPTPRPTAAAPTPTPFPKISRADLGTPTPTPVVELLETAVEPTDEVPPEVTVENKPGALPETAGTQEAPFQARVNSAALNVRQGPGASYKVMGTLLQGEQMPVLAVNPTHDWALVRLSTGGEGWVSLAYLTVEGSLADVPVMEDRGWKIEDSGLKIEDSGWRIEDSGLKIEDKGLTPTPYSPLRVPTPRFASLPRPPYSPRGRHPPRPKFRLRSH